MIDDNRFWIDPDTGERYEPLRDDDAAYIGCVIAGLVLMLVCVILLICVLAYYLCN